MATDMLDSKLDEALNQLGDVYAEKAAWIEDATQGKLGHMQGLIATKETAKHLSIMKTARWMEAKGVASKQIRGYVEKAVSVTRAGYGHGYNSPGVAGIFATPMNPDIVNAMSLPLPGLDAMLPEIPVVEDQPLYGIITGQTQVSGQSAPANDCAPWGVAGLTKICRQVSTLGRVGVSSDPINIERFGHKVDRADFLDYRLVGDPLAGTSDPNAPGLPGMAAGQGGAFLNDEFAKLMREMAVENVRRFAPDIYTSAPGNSADAYHSGWYRGIDLLVNTGQQDSVTQIACPRADSKIINFATASITGNNITSNATAASLMVDVVSELWYDINREAEEAGLQPVEFAFVMAPELFRELTAAWPCSYMTNRCLTASAGNPNQVIASEQVAMREDMRKGKFLWIDAQQVPVIIDSAITQTQGAGANAGSFTSSLYLLPFTVRGRFPVLTKTYFDYSGPNGAADALRRLGQLSYGMEVSPDGKFIFNLEKTGTCFQISSTRRPGLVLRTPYLAARITNIGYRPRLVTRSWNPGAASFYDNGGVTVGTGPSYFNPTTAG